MNDVRFELLKRRFAAPASSPSQMLLRAQAAKELSDGGVFAAASEETIQKIRRTLEGMLMEMSSQGGWQANKGSSIVGRVLDRLEQDQVAKERPRWPGGPWNSPSVAQGDRLGWLRTELISELGRSQNWELQLQGNRRRPIDDQRIEYLLGVASVIFESENPIAAADAWLQANYVESALEYGLASAADAEPYGPPEA